MFIRPLQKSIILHKLSIIVVSLGELRQVFLAMKVFQVKNVSSLLKMTILFPIRYIKPGNSRQNLEIPFIAM